MAGRISCELCQKEFPDDYLKIHMELHFQSMEKEYKCNVCQKIFYQERRLQIHSRMHKDNLKSCNVCSKSFRWSVSKSHMLKHTSINPSMCKLCPKSSLNYVDLNSHIRKVHNNHKICSLVLSVPKPSKTSKVFHCTYQRITWKRLKKIPFFYVHFLWKVSFYTNKSHHSHSIEAH